MATSSTKAVFLDALGTLVELDPPWIHLAAELGVEPSDDLARGPQGDGLLQGALARGPRRGLSRALRARCADILSWEIDREVPVETMMASIRFQPYPDAAPALETCGRAACGWYASRTGTSR